MFLVYFYAIIIITLLIYTIIEKERLTFYKAINTMRIKQSDSILIDIPIHSLNKIIHSTDISLLDIKTDILFKYKNLIFIATPIGRYAIILSKVPGSYITT